MVMGKTAERAGYKRDYVKYNLAIYLYAFPGILLFYGVFKKIRTLKIDLITNPKIFEIRIINF